VNKPPPKPKIGEPYTPNYEVPPYSEDGEDLTLIRFMLSLTPLERLQYAQSATQSMLKLKSMMVKTEMPSESGS
jgi:hypothetical protein